MELRNWKLYFPITFDLDKYHKIIGSLSDFLVTSKPDDVYEIKYECCMVGNIKGHNKIEDDELVKTSPVWDLTRLATDDKNSHDFIMRTKKNEYYLRIKDIDPKFRDEAWTFGTPGL